LQPHFSTSEHTFAKKEDLFRLFFSSFFFSVGSGARRAAGDRFILHSGENSSSFVYLAYMREGEAKRKIGGGARRFFVLSSKQQQQPRRSAALEEKKRQPKS
jgi:hypothetical protein